GRGAGGDRGDPALQLVDERGREALLEARRDIGPGAALAAQLDGPVRRERGGPGVADDLAADVVAVLRVDERLDVYQRARIRAEDDQLRVPDALWRPAARPRREHGHLDDLLAK